MKNKKLLKIKRTKEKANKIDEEIQKYYETILTNQLVFGNSSIINWVPETKEERITRFEKEIEEKQKELHQLKFSDKFNGMINDK